MSCSPIGAPSIGWRRGRRPDPWRSRDDPPNLDRSVAEVLVECADRPQRLEQDLPIFRRHRVVERPFPGRLGQGFGEPPAKSALMSRMRCGLPSKARVELQEGVVVELDERLEGDAKPPAIVQERVMMIGNAPRAGIEVETRVKLAALRRSAQFRVGVAASEGPIPPTRTQIVLEDLDLVASSCSSSIAAVMPARPAPRMTTEAPFASPSS